MRELSPSPARTLFSWSKAHADTTTGGERGLHIESATATMLPVGHLESPARPDLTAPRVYEIDPLCDPRWANLVESHVQASVFHTRNWLSALRNVYGYHPVVVTTCPPGEPLTNGLVFCRIRSWLTGARVVSLPFSDHCQPLISDVNEFDDMLLHMHRYVDTGEWKYVEARPIWSVPATRTGFRKCLTYYFHRLDLKRSTEQIFANFHKDCVQRKIRRAERENLNYEEGTSEQLLHKFYRLLVATRRRQSLPPQPLGWFQGLVAAFGGDLKIRVASQGDLPIASILTLSHKKTITYKYGCSDTAFHRLGGMALLFWKTIEEAKHNGFEELDMGRSDADNQGLITFKNHWGAASTLLDYWKYPHEPEMRAHIGQNKVIKRLVSTAPTLVLKAIGRLTYKHIG